MRLIGDNGVSRIYDPLWYCMAPSTRSARTWLALVMTEATARISPRSASSPSAATAAARTAGSGKLLEACKTASNAAVCPRPATLQVKGNSMPKLEVVNSFEFNIEDTSHGRRIKPL